MPEPRNLLKDIPAKLEEELAETLVRGSGVRVERIVSRGQVSPPDFWYDQDENEWVVLISGKARLRLAGREDPIGLEPGDFLEIPAHTRHRVEWTALDQPTVWLAVFYS